MHKFRLTKCFKVEDIPDDVKDTKLGQYRKHLRWHIVKEDTKFDLWLIKHGAVIGEMILLD